jgi:O-antigen/teichoic acid export membrane protein
MLVASILLARMLGAGDYGMYASAMAVVLFLAVPSSLGLPILLVRLIAAYQANRQWALMKGLLRRTNGIVLSLSLVLCALGSLVITLNAEWLGHDNAVTLWWAMALIPIVALNALRSGALRGLHSVIAGQLPECLVMPTAFIGALGLWWVLSDPGKDFSAAEATVFRLAATVLAFGVGTFFLLQRLPDEISKTAPSYQTGSWMKSTTPLLILTTMSIINAQSDILLLALLKNTEAAGVYQAAGRGAELVAFSLLVVSIGIQPSLSRFYATGDMFRLQRLVTTGTRATVAFAIPIALVLVLYAKPVLTFAFGDEFQDGAMSLIVLSCAYIVCAAIGPADQILNMTGHERYSAVGMAIGAVANVVLNLLLIPFWAMEGAAVATACSLVLRNLFLASIVQKRLQVSSNVLAWYARY